MTGWMRRWAAATVVVAVGVSGLGATSAAQEPPPPPAGSTAFRVEVTAPTDAVLPFGQQLTLDGVARWESPPAAPLRFVALVDAGSSAQGFGCGTMSALGCELTALRDVLGPLVDRGATEVAVIVSTEFGHWLVDPPGGATGTFQPPMGYVTAIDEGSFLTSLVEAQSLTAHAELARLLTGTGGRRGLVLTPGGPDYQVSNDERAALVATGAPVDAVMVPAGIATPCGSLTVAAALAAATGGTCQVSTAIARWTPRPALTDLSVTFDGRLLQRTFRPDGSWVASVPPLGGPMRQVLAVVTARFADGTAVSASRSYRLGFAPTVDLGVTEVTVDEGSPHTFAAPTVTDQDLGETFGYRWTPAAPLVGATTATPTYTGLDEGTETLTLTVTDSHGGTASDAVTMLVRNVAPSIADLALPGTVGVGQLATITYSVADPGVLDDVTTTVAWGDGGTSAPVGEDLGATHRYSQPGLHLVRVTADDGDGGVTVVTRAVQVVDASAPTFGVVPDEVVVEATGPGGATLDYEVPTASDGVDPTVAVTCTPAPGASVALGSSTITCTAVDDAGNTSTTTIPVEVRDTTPPVLDGMPADTTLRAGPDGTASLTYTTPAATDLVDPAPAVSCTPPSGTVLAVGQHVVECVAVDDAGNEVRDTFVVTVVAALRFAGFDHPVDNGVWNVVKAGRVVPLKWQVLDAGGAPVTSLGAVTSIRWTPLSCGDQRPSDAVEVYAAGASALRVDPATGWFHLNWQTPSRPGCGRLTVTLADGTTGTADFQLR